DPAVIEEPVVANRRPGKCPPVISIDRDRLLKQCQRLGNPRHCYWKILRKSSQVEIIGAEVGGRPPGGAADFGGLRWGLDNTRDARRYFVLKVKDVFERTSNRSAHRCVPLSASINCAVIRTRPPPLRTEPSST